MTPPTKKSSTTMMDQDSSEASSPPESNDQATTASTLTPAEKKLEIRRRTNRLSARRCRLRDKNILNGLHAENAMLRQENDLLIQENKNLRLKLELSEAENKRSLIIREKEKTSALQRMRILNGMAQRQAQQQQQSSRRVHTIPPQSVTTASALLQLKRQESPPPPPQLAANSPRSPSLLEGGGGKQYAYPVFNNNASGTSFSGRGIINNNGIGGEDQMPPSAASERVEGITSQHQRVQNLLEEVKAMQEMLGRHSI